MAGEWGEVEVVQVTVGGDGEVEEWGDRRAAMEAWRGGQVLFLLPSPCIQGSLLLDVLRNRVEARRGSSATRERCHGTPPLPSTPALLPPSPCRCLAIAIQRGLYISSSQEAGTVADILQLFRSSILHSLLFPPSSPPP